MSIFLLSFFRITSINSLLIFGLLTVHSFLSLSLSLTHTHTHTFLVNSHGGTGRIPLRWLCIGRRWMMRFVKAPLVVRGDLTFVTSDYVMRPVIILRPRVGCEEKFVFSNSHWNKFHVDAASNKRHVTSWKRSWVTSIVSVLSHRRALCVLRL